MDSRNKRIKNMDNVIARYSILNRLEEPNKVDTNKLQKLLVDLMHWCDNADLSHSQIMVKARLQYERELNRNDVGAKE